MREVFQKLIVGYADRGLQLRANDKQEKKHHFSIVYRIPLESLLISSSGKGDLCTIVPVNTRSRGCPFTQYGRTSRGFLLAVGAFTFFIL